VGDVVIPLPCETPGTLSALGRSLPGFASALRDHDEVTIVAIGLSSTKGDGASSDAASYPSRLKGALAARFPKPTINVLNLGIGGQEARMRPRDSRQTFWPRHPRL
jgi:acyl-CoA thioesterase-1